MRARQRDLTDKQSLRIEAARKARRIEREALERLRVACRLREGQWFVLQVLPGHDIVVDNFLAGSKIEHWTPGAYEAAMPRYGRPTEKFRPVFPGYVFVKVPPGAATWASLGLIEGVVGPIGGPIAPHRVRDKEIEDLRQFLKDAGAAKLKALRVAIETGDHVGFHNGPLQGLVAVVKLLWGKRAMVEVDIFGRRTQVEVPVAKLAKPQ